MERWFRGVSTRGRRLGGESGRRGRLKRLESFKKEEKR
jgi:hypothetical protein